MTKKNNVLFTEPMLNNMNKKDVKILEDLMKRTEGLPEILHLRTAEIG